MTTDQENEMKEWIEKTNSKLDLISFKLESYIASDYEWKKSAQPSIDMGNNVRSFGLIVAGFIGFIAALAGIVEVFIQLFRHK